VIMNKRKYNDEQIQEKLGYLTTLKLGE